MHARQVLLHAIGPLTEGQVKVVLLRVRRDRAANAAKTRNTKVGSARAATASATAWSPCASCSRAAAPLAAESDAALPMCLEHGPDRPDARVGRAMTAFAQTLQLCALRPRQVRSAA